MIMYFVLAVLSFLTLIVHSEKLVSFKAHNKVSRLIVPEKVAAFSAWFASTETPLRILRSNPGIQSLEKGRQEGAFEAALTPLRFPGLQVISSVRFSSEFDGRALIVRCDPEGLVLKYEGLGAVTRLVKGFRPSVLSSTTCSFHETSGLLESDAHLSIGFNVTSWLPIPLPVLEERGGAVIKLGLERDMCLLLDTLLVQFETSLLESNTT